MYIKGFSIILCLYVSCLLSSCAAGDDGTSVSTLASEAAGESETKAKALAEEKAKEKEKKNAEKEEEKKKEKELAAKKATARKEITNANDRIQRAQSNLTRNEQLLDSLKGRRDQTKKELSDLLASARSSTVSNGTVSTTTTNIRRSQDQLNALIKQQEADIVAMQAEIQKQKADIAALEKLVDDLTKTI